MKRRAFLMSGAAALTLPAAMPAFAQGPSGLTDAGIAALDSKLRSQAEAGMFPGATWLVARGDDVRVGMVGTFEAGGQGAPMARDTVFRIASVTKPIVAAGVMMLIEDGRIALDEPVDRLLPELADRRVLTRLDAALDSTEPAERPITVRDLLTFTMGMGIQFDPNLPIQQAIEENQLENGYMIPPSPHDPDEWIRRLGTLPLMYQPGATWLYNTGSLVQGVLIRRASGQPLEAFLKERIFDPLGMVDTGFFVPAEKLHRLPTAYGFSFETNQPTVDDSPDGQWSALPSFPNGGGGLVSTVDDLLSFARVMMNKGAHGSTQLLSETNVAEMTHDQLTGEQKAMGGLGVPNLFDAMGWGYGMAVTTAPATFAPNPGRYGWDGGFGTSWANDPTTGLTGIFLSQSVGYYVASNQFTDFWSGAYAALAA